MSVGPSHDSDLPHSAEAMAEQIAAGCAAAGEAASQPAAIVPLYFTPNRNSVDEGRRSRNDPDGSNGVIEVRAVGCKCRFCPSCCLAQGIKLRKRLMPILATFQRIIMLTLTIDPKLFDAPVDAYEYVRKRRAVAELVRALRKAGHLDSERYFYVLEWQQHTEMPHYHVLVESSFIPHRFLADVWGRNRPKSAPPVEGDQPEFGHVNFREQGFKSSAHAAHYASKYLMKVPEYGYPAWVLHYRGQIKRCSGSRGLWGTNKRRPSEQRISEAPARQRTVADRIARCGQRAILVERLPSLEGPATFRFISALRVPYSSIAYALRPNVPIGRAFTVSLAEARMLEQGSRVRVPGDTDNPWHPEMELTANGTWIVRRSPEKAIPPLLTSSDLEHFT